MKEAAKASAKRMLDHYLDESNRRKTPERFAILDAVYSFKSLFTLQELSDKLESERFFVSRATLYNTLKLFVNIHIAMCHKVMGMTKYEAATPNTGHVSQICTMCGKTTEVKSSFIQDAIEQTKLKRFRRDGYNLYIYGVCSSCQAKLTRQQNKKKSIKL